MRLSLVAALFALIVLLGTASWAGAEGDGSPAECIDIENEGGSPTSVDAGEGNVITGICIKAGQLHTGLITSDGLVGCYDVEGIGEQVVTVTKTSEGPECQDVSHIDYTVGQTPPPPFCEVNPEAPECQPDFCEENPDAAECQPDFCEENPASPLCQPDFCELNPTDPACLPDNGDTPETDEGPPTFTGSIPTGNFPNPGGIVTPPAPVAQVAAVQEVLPVRLATTGMGSGGSNGIAWAPVLALALLGIGGASALVARNR